MIIGTIDIILSNNPLIYMACLIFTMLPIKALSVKKIVYQFLNWVISFKYGNFHIFNLMIKVYRPYHSEQYKLQMFKRNKVRPLCLSCKRNKVRPLCLSWKRNKVRPLSSVYHAKEIKYVPSVYHGKEITKILRNLIKVYSANKLFVNQ